MSADDRFVDDDEIEILEVIAVDEEAPRPATGASGGEPAGEPSFPPEASTGGGDDGTWDRESFLRLQADFDNFRKRMEREREDYERHAQAALVERLLPALDNLERALSLEQESEVYDPFRDGVSLIYRQLLDELRRAGLRPLYVVGEVFDPNVHEAVATEPSAEVAPHTVLEEVQRGYRFVDRLLRPARVKVSVEPEDADRAEDVEESSHG